MPYTVYSHTNRLNGKMYIGITSRPVKERWRAKGDDYMGQPFYSAIQKYGWDNFDHTVLASGLSKAEAKTMEIMLIEKYQTTDSKKGYNATKGGESANGLVHSEETKRKISNALKGRPSPNKGKKHPNWKFSGENAVWYGKHHTEETKQKMRDVYQYRITDESRKKMSENRKGKNSGAENSRAHSVICIDTGKIYKTIKEAAEDTGARSSHISSVCSGERKRAGGYRWEYAV